MQSVMAELAVEGKNSGILDVTSGEIVIHTPA